MIEEDDVPGDTLVAGRKIFGPTDWRDMLRTVEEYCSGRGLGQATVRKMCFSSMLSMARDLEKGDRLLSSRLSPQSKASLHQWLEVSLSHLPVAASVRSA